MQQIRAGQVIQLAEADYAYGVGPLTLRVTEVRRHPDSRWLSVRGIEVRWNGQDGRERDVLVRADAAVTLLRGTGSSA